MKTDTHITAGHRSEASLSDAHKGAKKAARKANRAAARRALARCW